MTYFKVHRKRQPSPGELNASEKCIHCGIAFVDFADIFGDGRVLGCYVCGGVFMSKECREHDVKEKGKILSGSRVGKTATDRVLDEIEKDGIVADFKAKCGKVCKNLAGLKAHERKCNKCK